MAGHLRAPIPDRKGHYGERKFIERLVQLGDDHTHVWGDVDYLPLGVPDIDVLLAHEDIACFNIEVKAVPLDAIANYGLKVCEIRGRSGQHNPVQQAGRATTGLITYLGTAAGVRSPFFFATAAFPLIRRSDFVARFDTAPIRSQVEGLLFAEDLENSDVLIERLRQIRKTPPHKGSPRREIAPTPTQMKALIEVLDPGPVPPASPTDAERGALLSSRVGRPGQPPKKASPASPFLAPGARKPIIFRGAPGTGKTVQLQEVAVAHARAGRAVLFTCFNKVLASTLRGILSTQEWGEAVNKRVVVTHVDELITQLDGDDAESFRGLFGTVCVDEAQDMPEHHFEFLRVLAAEDAEWFLADGPGQELYGTANKTGVGALTLEAARREGQTVHLRRNFRNKGASFLFNQAVYEHAPDLSKIQDWVARHPLGPKPDSDGMLDFGSVISEPGGELPVVERVSIPAGNGWRQAKLEQYTAIIRRELEKLAAEGKRRDLAILVSQGDSKSGEAEIARQALLSLRVPVHDQVATAGRGHPVPKDHVRLVTIHSARGIEASRVIILGADRGISPAEMHRRNSRIMAHIALSRGQLGTTVVSLDDSQNPFVTFIEELTAAYARCD